MVDLRRRDGVAGWADDGIVVVVADREDERPREGTTAVVVAVAACASALVSVFDAAELSVAGAFTASHPVITTIPAAPVTPVMRRARRAGCGRRGRGASIAAIIESQSEDKLGAG